MKGETRTKVNYNESTMEMMEDVYTLMLINDEVNTFDYVIDNLMELCHHTYEQAFQCAWITHCYGKCDIMHGNYSKLKRIADIMTERGLTVKIIADLC